MNLIHTLLAFVAPLVAFVPSRKVEAPVKKTDPLSLETLIAWLETKPAADKYPSTSISDCLICQYASFVSGTRLSWTAALEFLGFDYAVISGNEHQIFPIAHNGNDTFGAALVRARAAHNEVR